MCWKANDVYHLRHLKLHHAWLPVTQLQLIPVISHDNDLTTTSRVVSTIEHPGDVSILERGLDRGSSGVSTSKLLSALCLHLQHEFKVTYIPPAVMYIPKRTSSMCIAYLDFWPIEPDLNFLKSCIQRSPGKIKLNGAKQNAEASPSR